MPKSETRTRRRPLLGIILVAAALAVSVASARGARSAADRTAALVEELRGRGLLADPDGVLWLVTPPLGVMQAAVAGVPVVVRARTGPEEPHDIYLTTAKLSPEGVLIDSARAYNLTETSAVDELAPVGRGSRFAFSEQPLLGDEGPSTVRVIDLAGQQVSPARGWSRVQRVQAAITRLQQTGRLSGVGRVTYSVQPAPGQLRVSLDGEVLRVDADDRSATISLAAPLEVPSWLSVEIEPERQPGNLVTWAVDRVRTEIGDEAMQYVKAIAFSALDVLLSGKEAVTGDTGEEDIAADLGADSLEEVTRSIPVDPEIGFPPPPLDVWVTPALPGEGVWQHKTDDPFIHDLPGLPPTFVTTFIRGDRQRKVTRVYVALWDPRLVQLNMMAGTAEPKSATGATGPGLIPREPRVLKRVAAAMNAGFQALHGEFGMMSDGVIYLPPKPYAATVATMRDGSTAFGSWPNDANIPPDILSYRQNMTVMVLDEQYNPYGRTWWGGTPSDWEDKTHTVRTGICLTKEGFTAYFYGADLSPSALARAMIQTRCSYGVALDMNAGHSGLEFYKVAPTEELGPLDRPIRRDWERDGQVPGLDGWSFRARRLIVGMGLMNFPRYIKREGRDFFYLTLRYVLPGPPIEPLDGAKAGEADGQWTVKGLPQHGFPYALARSELALPSGARVRVLQLDPRMLTTEVGAGEGGSGEPAVVAQVNPNAAGKPSLWFSQDAFTVGDEPLVSGAVRVASAASDAAGRAVAALGVADESGMAVYVETLGDPAPAVARQELAALLGRLGSSEIVALTAPLELALGGDTTLSGVAVRLPSSPDTVLLMRKPGAGARRIFEDTPIVPFKQWYPLQSRRIRYFKERKKKEDD